MNEITNKEWCEQKHSKDTAGKIIYDVHCPYCLEDSHSKDLLPPLTTNT